MSDRRALLSFIEHWPRPQILFSSKYNLFFKAKKGGHSLLIVKALFEIENLNVKTVL